MRARYLRDMKVASADLQLGDQQVRSGDLVWAMLGAANRDPARFAEPQVFDAGRTDNGHLAFGHGRISASGHPSPASRRRSPSIGPTPASSSPAHTDAIAWRHDYALRGPLAVQVGFRMPARSDRSRRVRITDVKTYLPLGRHPEPVPRQDRDRRGHLRLGRIRAVRPREEAVVGAIEHYREFLIGADPFRIGAIWQGLYRSQYFEGGRVAARGDLGDRHRAPRHQGQGARRAGLPAARRQAARP